MRTYRKPIPRPANFAPQPQEGLRISEVICEEMFVVLENPLLEFNHSDLVFLKECGISVVSG